MHASARNLATSPLRSPDERIVRLNEAVQASDKIIEEVSAEGGAHFMVSRPSLATGCDGSTRPPSRRVG